MKTLLCLGLGYSARALAKRMISQGWNVIGTTRSQERARELWKDGFEALVWPCDLSEALSRTTHIVASAAPENGHDPFLSVCSRIAKSSPLWVGYLSTVGVYGDTGGAWVDEASPTAPGHARSKERLEVEKEWLDTCLPVHIFRLAGIYGPGRGPLQQLREGRGQRIAKSGHVFCRVHVADIVQVLEASILRPNPSAIYNVCDDEPAPAEEVISFAAKALNLQIPPIVPFEKAEMTPLARSFYEECRRVRNERIKKELGVKLIHPNYRSGLEETIALQRPT